MPFAERKEILSSIKGVRAVVKAQDEDGTVCSSLADVNPTYFANGGDRTNVNTPEMSVCKKYGIEMLWNIGGGKIQSSSDLVEKAREEQ
jgi:D-beta-D-heptose 7-phosphate kinase/D-beta-D-heptose 1-phosphate adenosyltransferase